jgi:hypothetical protein
MSETKAELEQRVAKLERENAELKAAAEQDAGTDLAGTARKRQRPMRPVDGDGNAVLSEGERQALEAEGVTVSPFTGETINALDEGVEPASPRALRAAERAQLATERVDPNAWPLAGPPPAEGGNTDLGRTEN